MNRRAAVRGLAVLLAAAAGCETGPGNRPEEVRAVVERAAAAWEARDFEAMVSTYTGAGAGRYREQLQTVHGGDREAFFASKRRMAVVGPVSIRRRAFAGVRVIILRRSGYKPYDQVSVLFQNGAWRINSFLPGDVEEPRVEKASPYGIIGLLRDSAEASGRDRPDDAFSRMQTVRAIEVVALRRLAEASEPLIELLERTERAAIRQFAAYTLGLLDDGRAVPALRAALADADLRVRADAATSLARLGDGGALPAIRGRASGDPAAWVRRQAAAAAEILERQE